MISLNQAHEYIGMIEPLAPLVVPLEKAFGLVCAADVRAVSHCPTVDSSLKDGYAVVSSDIADASPASPVILSVAGAVTAGDTSAACEVRAGTAVRIMTGAPLPRGATAVLSSEFAEVHGGLVTVLADSPPRKNILYKGSDILKEQVVLTRGEYLGPAQLGFLAAAGVNEVVCYPQPKIAVAATGSELVWPGEPLAFGKVAASNMVIAAAELQALGIKASTVLLRDNLDNLQEYFHRIVQQVDLLITCGGVLDGDKDLTMRAMEQIGMEKIFHRVRIGPGKGACMGRVGKTVIFNLPGGPPSNHVALLLLALSGVRRLMGFVPFLPHKRQVFVTEKLKGQIDWTQLVYGRVSADNGRLYAVPLRTMGRLEAMAKADALIEIPEGCSVIREGSLAEAWFFRQGGTV